MIDLRGLILHGSVAGRERGRPAVELKWRGRNGFKQIILHHFHSQSLARALTFSFVNKKLHLF